MGYYAVKAEGGKSEGSRICCTRRQKSDAKLPLRSKRLRTAEKRRGQTDVSWCCGGVYSRKPYQPWSHAGQRGGRLQIQEEEQSVRPPRAVQLRFYILG